MPEETKNDAAVLDDTDVTQQGAIEEVLDGDGQADDASVVEDAAGQEEIAADAPTEAIDDELLDRAESYGMDPEDAKALGSNQAIEAALNAADNLVSRAGREQTQEPLPKTNGAARPQERAAPEPLPDLTLEMDSVAIEEIGETAHKALQKFVADVGVRVKSLASENEGLREEVAQAKGLATQTSGELASARIVQLVEGLPESWTPILGKGRIKNGSTEHKNREKLSEGMLILVKGLQATDGKTPTLEGLFNRALGMTFQRKTRNIAETATRRAAQDRASQVIGAPAHSKKARGPKDERARVFEGMDKLGAKSPAVAAILRE